MGMFGMFKTAVKEEARRPSIVGAAFRKSEAVKAMEILMVEEAEKKAEAASTSTKAAAAAKAADQPPAMTPMERLHALWEDFFYLIMWLTWLFVGAIFYMHEKHMNLDGELRPMGFAKGFYMAVNIGYSIGWGDIPEYTDSSRWFSTFYVIVGASFVGLALGFFADKVVADHDNWFANAEQKEIFENQTARGTPHYSKIWAFVKYEQEKFQALGMWLVMIAIMTIFAMCKPIGYDFIEALYFAVSSCSTGGHWSIPAEDNWVYGVVGLFAAIGVPLMGIAMASLASFLVHGNDLDGARDAIYEAVTNEELDMLVKFGLTDDDGVLDKSEFVILSMVRTGVDPGLVKMIAERFTDLDKDGDGKLTLDEILERTNELKHIEGVDTGAAAATGDVELLFTGNAKV